MTAPFHKGPARTGFTLIELLVVVLMIGILSAIALPQYEKAVIKARSVQAITAANSLHQSVQRYYLENGEYPTKLADLDIEIQGRNNTDNYIYFKSGGFCRLESGKIACEDFGGPSLNVVYEIKYVYGGRKGVHMCYAYSSDNYKAAWLCQSLMPNKDWADLCGGGRCRVWMD